MKVKDLVQHVTTGTPVGSSSTASTLLDASASTSGPVEPHKSSSSSSWPSWLWSSNHGSSSSSNSRDHAHSIARVGAGIRRHHFSTLLLEHGEVPWQDWAVQCQISVVPAARITTTSSAGIRRPPDDANRPTSSSAPAPTLRWEQSPHRHHDRRRRHQQPPSPNDGSRRRAPAPSTPASPGRRSASDTSGMDPSIFTQHGTTLSAQGRWHVCSRSFVFEPNDLSRTGILRIPFARMVGPPLLIHTHQHHDEDGDDVDHEAAGEDFLPRSHDTDEVHRPGVIRIVAQRVVVMKPHGVVGPYETLPLPSHHHHHHQAYYHQIDIELLHSSPQPPYALGRHLYQLYQGVMTTTTAGDHTLVPPSRHRSTAELRRTHGTPELAMEEWIRQHEYQQRQQKPSESTQQAGTNSLVLSDGSSAPGPVNPPASARSSTTSMLMMSQMSLMDLPHVLMHVPREQVWLAHVPCSMQEPLQSQAGLLAITSVGIYFQPRVLPIADLLFPTGHRPDGTADSNATSSALSGNSTRTSRCYHHQLVATARRYQGLRDTALELYWKDQSSTLLAFERRHDRDKVLQLLSAAPCLTDRDFVVQVLQAWKAGQINNYQYLYVLNIAAGRSLHDLSRYPVFPWVLADYTSPKLNLDHPATFRDLSKPIGALNPERLEYFRQRLQGMQQDQHQLHTTASHGLDDQINFQDHQAFLYGTHYSAPGYVLYYLVRSMPEHMLCLQNGKFDAPDRMFHSMAHSYQCVLTNHADLKELIPEFFHPKNEYDLLINTRGLQLGATQQGDRVDDVILPPWAKSPRDFIKKNRQALESPICTSMLPMWIDLIFGCKSRGEAALEADNLFHPTAYLGPSDLAAMKTETERHQAELQATEFGIVPDKLFCAPHPSRIGGQGLESPEAESVVSLDIGRSSHKDSPSQRESWELLESPGEVPLGVIEPLPYIPPGLEEKSEIDSSLPTTHSSYSRQKLQTSEGPDLTGDKPFPGRSVPLSGSGEATTNEPHTWDATRSKGSFESEADQAGPVTLKQETNGADYNIVSLQVGSPADEAGAVTGSGYEKPTEWNMKVIERKRIHNDAVSGCVLQLKREDSSSTGTSKETPSILVTTSLDGGLLVHKVSLNSVVDEREKNYFSATLTRFSYSTIMSRNQTPASSPSPMQISKLSEYRSHSSRDPLACLVLAGDGVGGTVAFAGGHDDVLLAYGIHSACAVASVYSHRDAVTGLDLIARSQVTDQLNHPLWRVGSTHFMVSGSWDATVKIWPVEVTSGETVSIHREPLAELFDADSSILCVSAMASGDPNTRASAGSGMVVAAGCADGSFCVWKLYNDGMQVVIHKEPAKRGSGPCSVVKWTNEAGRLHLLTAFATGKVTCYLLSTSSVAQPTSASNFQVLSSSTMLKRTCAVSVGVAISSLAHVPGLVLVGCADGGLRLIPFQQDLDGCRFRGQPTLWRAVNNPSTSPGLSSISVVPQSSLFVTNAAMTTATQTVGGEHRLICCTGAEDGSVALFELYRGS